MSLQEEIDNARDAGGGTVLVSGLTEISEPVHVWENVILHGENGAELRTKPSYVLNSSTRSMINPYSGTRFENIKFNAKRGEDPSGTHNLQPLLMGRPVEDVEFTNCTFSNAIGK